jgi:hypothetical protein
MNVLDEDIEKQLASQSCEIQITDLMVTVLERPEGEEGSEGKVEGSREESSVAQALSRAKLSDNPKANTGHWAENLAKSSEVVLRATFSSTILPTDVSKRSKKASSSKSPSVATRSDRKTEGERKAAQAGGGSGGIGDNSFTWGAVKLSPFIPDEKYARRNYVVVGLTMQTADAQTQHIGANQLFSWFLVG